MYAQLAHGLARRGIASVRYDKRGIGEGAKTIDHSALTLDDYVNDVSAVARVVAADSQYSKVYLVGHSEGAGLVLQAANRGTPVAGIAMLSGIGRPLQEVLHDQFSLLTDSLTVQRIDEAFARFLEGDDVPDAPEIARPVLVPGYRRLFASMAAYDPQGEVARAQVPVLIVQGGMDLQVDIRDAENLHAAQPAATLLVIPEANHTFKAASSREPAAQMALYQDRSIPIVPELVDGIADWIASGTQDPSP
jgi:alpha-beta hydrolase superfamily lysophospholipase